ncbi:MAG: glycosyltransferase [Lysobacterales bacterium]
MTVNPTQELAQDYRVLFVSDLAQTKGHIYRVLHSVAALQNGGVGAEWVSSAEATDEKVKQANIVIVFRGMWNGVLNDLYTRCRENGIPIGFDLDDLIFDPDVLTEKHFDFFRLMTDDVRKDWLENRIGMYRQAVLESDFGIVSTSPLAAAVENLQKPAYVLANGFGNEMAAAAEKAIVEFADKPSSRDGRIRLGYASGTPSHQKDFATIAPALSAIMDESPQIILTIVGHLNLKEFPVLDRFTGRIETRPLVPHDQLLREYARFDLNLAPLEMGNPFCEAKSALKFVEAALVSVPTIAAATLPYQNAIQDGETGWTVQRPRDWQVRIGSLVDDAAGRQRMGRNARQHVQNTLGPEAKFSDLKRILTSISPT